MKKKNLLNKNLLNKLVETIYFMDSETKIIGFFIFALNGFCISGILLSLISPPLSSPSDLSTDLNIMGGVLKPFIFPILLVYLLISEFIFYYLIKTCTNELTFWIRGRLKIGSLLLGILGLCYISYLTLPFLLIYGIVLALYYIILNIIVNFSKVFPYLLYIAGGFIFIVINIIVSKKWKK